MLEHYKLLDMNGFLHNFYPYVVNRPYIERCLRTSSQHSNSSSGAPPMQTFIEFNIIGDNKENAGLRPRATAIDPPNWSTLFLSVGVQINKFGTYDGAKFMRDVALSSADRGSLSQKYRARVKQVWTVGKDADQPVFGRWFGLVWKDLGSGGTLPGAKAVKLPIGLLIRILAVREMSMMTRTIIGHVLHRRVHLEMLLI